jgi:hypothetical protein
MLQTQLHALEGQMQRLSQAQLVAEQAIHQGRSKDGPYIGTALAQLMNADLARTQANKGQFGALAAYMADGKPRLCEFGVTDFQPEQKDAGGWYTSMGSGQILADPYLAFMRRTFWRSGQPNVEEAIFAALWVIYHAIEAAPGLIAHPIDIAVLKKRDGSTYTAQLLTEAERLEHLNTVKAADDHLIAFRESPRETPAMPPAPEVPAA